MKLVVAVVLCSLLAACGNSSGAYAADDELGLFETREPFDEDAARDAAEQDLAAEGYDFSYGCTSDCSGHEAGWQWRAEHGYSTPGTSQSFDEGGRAFDEALDDRVEEMRYDYDAGFDPEY